VTLNQLKINFNGVHVMEKHTQEAFHDTIDGIIKFCDAVIANKNTLTFLEIGLVEQFRLSIETYKKIKGKIK